MKPIDFEVRDYIVMLDRQQALSAEELSSALQGLPLSKAEIHLAARRQRGFVFGQRSENVATAIADALTRAGIHAMAMPVADLPDIRKARRVLRLEVGEDGLYLPGVSAAGANGFIPAESIRFLAGGLLTQGLEIEFTENERLLMQADCSGDATKAIAQRASEANRDCPFPLTDFLLKAPEETVNTMRRLAESARKDGRKAVKGIAKRFREGEQAAEIPRYSSEYVDLKGRLLIVHDQGAHVFHADEAVYERASESEFGHWVRAFQPLVAEAVGAIARAHGDERIPQPEDTGDGINAKCYRKNNTTISPETVVFSYAFDDASYLFASNDTFLDNAYWWMLNGEFVE